MKITIKTKNIELTQALRVWVEKKLNSLGKFVSVFQEEEYFDLFFGKGKPNVEMWVEIGKESFHHRKGLVYRAEAQLRFPKESLRAESLSEDLRVAITDVKDELQRQIKRYKDRIAAKRKRKIRAIKKSVRLSSSAKLKRKKGARIREEGS